MNAADGRVPMVQFLTRTQGMVQAYAYAIVRDFQLAEDIYQEVAMIVAERWGELSGREELEGWMKETTRRKALEARRKLKRQPLTLPNHVFAQVGACFKTTPRSAEGKRDLRDLLLTCVEKLGNLARRAIEARYAEDRSCEEIAAHLGRSVQSVYSILKRSRLALAQCVDRSYAAKI